MGAALKSLIEANTPLSRLIAADEAEECGMPMLADELRGSDFSVAEFPSGYGYGYGSGDGYGYGYGDGSGSIYDRQFC